MNQGGVGDNRRGLLQVCVASALVAEGVGWCELVKASDWCAREQVVGFYLVTFDKLFTA
jgi:hypothetical protein